MKKLFYLAVLFTGLSAAATPPDVNEKVLKAFHETFTNAENVTWTENETNCQANFKISEMQVRVMYDNEGNLLETVRYYSEKNLPLNILAKIRKKYANQEVFGVTEISSEYDINYNIVLRDKKNWYIVKADPYGNLQQTDKFKNAGE